MKREKKMQRKKLNNRVRNLREKMRRRTRVIRRMEKGIQKTRKNRGLQCKSKKGRTHQGYLQNPRRKR